MIGTQEILVCSPVYEVWGARESGSEVDAAHSDGDYANHSVSYSHIEGWRDAGKRFSREPPSH